MHSSLSSPQDEAPAPTIVALTTTTTSALGTRSRALMDQPSHDDGHTDNVRRAGRSQLQSQWPGPIKPLLNESSL